MSKEFNINISPAAKTFMHKLNEAGFGAFVVGGSLRDCVMGRTPNDFDVATSASPDEIKSVLSDYRLIETGIKHGTVSAVLDTEIVEITTFRLDGEYSDNRRPDKVEFTNSLSEDLRRRDFTMNAMAYDEKGGIVDLYGGRKDIENKIIRCVGDADKRFKEDALRILRALRFSSTLGFGIEDETKKAIFKNKELIKNISYERIYAEFDKLLLGGNVENVLGEYYEVIGEFIPEILPMVGFKQNTPYHKYDVFVHTLKAVSSTQSEEILRWTMFLHDIGKPHCYTEKDGVGHFYGHGECGSEIAETVLKRLRAPKNMIKTVCELIRLHDISVKTDKIYVKKLLSKIGEDNFMTLLKVKFADDTAKANSDEKLKERLNEARKVAQEIIANGECIALKTLAISGNDIINEGIANGKDVGELLDYALNEVITQRVDNEKSQLLHLLKSRNK